MRTRAVVAMLALACAPGCAVEDDPDALGEYVSEINLDNYVLPSLSVEERAAIVSRYDAIDPTDLVPRGLLEDALIYFDVNQAYIPKRRYLAIADFSLYSGKDRFWLVDLQTGAVEPHKVAHGNGSDPDHDGYANTFSNISGSNMTSLGFYLTAEVYDGAHPHSMRLDGLSRDGSPNGMANTNARTRLIVMHEASYVDDANTSKQGRSNGCPALDPDVNRGVVDKIRDGSLLYHATRPLAPPVGRTPPMDPEDPSGDDPMMEDPMDEMSPEDTAGCSATGGGQGIALVLALALGLRRRKR